jgi:hypothetical protein
MRRRRPLLRTLIGVAAGLAALAATATLALTRNGSARPALPLAPLTALGHLRPAAAAGPLGARKRPDARRRTPRATTSASPGSADRPDRLSGRRTARVPHPRPPQHRRSRPFTTRTGRHRRRPSLPDSAYPAGRFVAAAACFTWLHTHAADGIVHIESPVERTYTLGQFFDIWGQPLNRHRVGPARGRVTAIFDGRVFTGDPRTIPLLAHSQIELEVGRPLVKPETIAFPPGL